MNVGDLAKWTDADGGERRGRVDCIDDMGQVHARDQFGQRWIMPIVAASKVVEKKEGKRRGRIGRSRSGATGGGF